MGIHVNDLKSSTYIRAVLMLLIAFGYANAGSPYIANSIPYNSYSSQYENFKGTVCRLHLKDSDGNDHIRFKPDSDKTSINFNFEPDGGTNDVWVNITTKKELDRETLGSTIKIELIITDDQHNEIKYEHLVYILDVNDNSPVFQSLPYTFDIDELPCNKTIVYSNIRATDRDSGPNGTVTFSMKPKTQTAEYNNTFLIDPATATVSLVKCLSFERNTYYHFVITAKDGGPNGGLISTADLIIQVKDVQNKPPFFTGTYRKTINGSIARVYSSCGDLFAIDNHTGVIYAATNVDINTGQ
ncbi:protocadherin Fat 3-like, partial [Ruditapes philippinarum]|uniref:protocadherin Fat 3-like n=1 Tax=Ruditapes philippinarum TaxID=129788 RepID=UPI00295B4F6E